jgi:hypothetical protein
MSSQTGPRRPVVARCTASSRCRRIAAGSITVAAYLVIGRTIETMSTSCGPICRTPLAPMRSSRFTCPEMISSGTDSIQAPAHPVMAFVAPGPVVTRAQPRRPFTRA